MIYLCNRYNMYNFVVSLQEEDIEYEKIYTIIKFCSIVYFLRICSKCRSEN